MSAVQVVKDFSVAQRSGQPRLLQNDIFCLVMAVMLTTLLPSCRPDTIQDNSTQKYFDIKGYFQTDTAKLRKLNHPTIKTVSHNGSTETKTVHINNWGLELSLFSESDINKPAWRDSYTVSTIGDITGYTAKYPDLKTRDISIKKQGGKIKSILINNSTENMLYKTTEKLSYFPDSVYVIQKYQKVRLLGANTYTIKGSLK